LGLLQKRSPAAPLPISYAAVALDEAAARKTNGSPTPSYHYHLGMALASKGDKTSREARD
jgi:hypothetical protein